jgi:hypothetical protein
MPEKESIWKKNMTMIRDIVFVVLFLSTIVGWIRSETVKKAKLENEIEILNNKLDDISKHVEKTNDILNQQQILNGKIIQYMEMK